MTRLSHFALDLDPSQSLKNSEFYEEKVPDEIYFKINDQILELSKQIVIRIQEKNIGVVVKSIKITYLVEKDNYDPWFVGTDYCHIYNKSASNSKRLKSPKTSKTQIN